MLAVIAVDSLSDGAPNWNDGRTTLREALASAFDGDTIEIASSGTIQLTEGELLIEDDVTILGNDSIVDAQQQSRAFLVVGSDRRVAIRELTIRNGLANDWGGGIFAGGENIQLSLKGCHVLDNRVEAGGSPVSGPLMHYGGGGIALNEGTLTLEQTTLRGNIVHATDKVYLWAGGAGAIQGDVVLNQCDVINNTLSGVDCYGYGGGVAAAKGSVSATASSFSGNKAPSGSAPQYQAHAKGGAVMANERFDAYGCEFLSNEAQDGAAMYATSLSLTDCRVNDNMATIDAHYNGSAILATDGTVTRSEISHNVGLGITSHKSFSLSDSVVAVNTDRGVYNGGLGDGLVVLRCDIVDNGHESAMSGGGVDARGDLTIADSRITGNRVQKSGGGIRAEGDVLVITNCTIANNTAQDQDGGGVLAYSGQLTIVDTVVSGNTAGTWGGGISADYGLFLTRTDVSDNVGRLRGGGIEACTVVARECTVSRNHVTGSGSEGFGGGISASNITLLDSVVTGNTATQYGGGLFGSTIVLYATKVVGNAAYGETQLDCPRDVYGTILKHDTGDGTLPHPDDVETTGADIASSENLYMNASIAGSICNYCRDVLSGGTGTIQPPEEQVVAIVAPTKPFPFGEPIVLDASPSYRAEMYAWDLNDDGAYDDATGATITLSWERVEELEFEVGANVIGLRVTDTDGRTDETKSSVVIESEADPDPEWLARELAYKPGVKKGESIGFGCYVVDKVFQSMGFYALGLIRSPVSGLTTKDPILVLRGTDPEPLSACIIDVLSDLNPMGVGYNQFVANMTGIYKWMGDWKEETVDIVGHSLGGALAQWIAAGYTSEEPGQLGQIVTFNSPGIAEKHADKFRPEKCERVEHHIVNGDVVSMAGLAFIKGSSRIYTYTSGESLVEYIMDKHLRPLTIPEYMNRDGDPVYMPVDIKAIEISTATLNSQWFHFNDPEYLSWIDSGRKLLPLLKIHRLFFRGETEKWRKDVGRPVYQLLGIKPEAAYSVTIPDVVIVRDKFEFRDLKATWNPAKKIIDAEATLLIHNGWEITVEVALIQHQLNRVSVEVAGMNIPLGQTGVVLQKIKAELEGFAKPDKEPTTFSGTLGVTFGPGVDVRLPGWLGGGAFEGALVGLEGSILVNREQFKLSGKAFLVDEQVASIETSLSVLLKEERLEGTFSGSMIAGLIQSTASASLSRVGRMELLDAAGSASIAVPKDVWFLGGLVLANASYIIHFSNDHIPANDHLVAWGKALGLFRFGLEVTFDGHYRILGVEEVPAPAQASLLSFPSQAESASADNCLLVASWPDEAQSPAGVLVLPNGTRITEAEMAGRSDMAVATELCTSRQRVYMLSYAPSQIAGWTVEMTGVTGPVTQEVLVFCQEPEFSFASIIGGGTQPVTLAYSLSDDDSIPSVSLYVDEDNLGFDGRLITSGLTAADSPYVWNPTGIAAGSYYIYAVVEDGSSVPVMVYQDSPIMIETTPTLGISDDQGSLTDQFIRFATRASSDWTPETRRFRLANVGTAPLEISFSDPAVSDSSAFQLEFLDSTGQSLAMPSIVLKPGETVAAQLTFVAETPGIKDWEVCLKTNDPTQPTVILTARGVFVDPVAVIERTTTGLEAVVLAKAELTNVAHGLDGTNVRLLVASPTLHTYGLIRTEVDHIVFEPYAGASGSSIFTYTLIDGQGKTAQCAVSVTKEGNTPPKADANGPYTVPEGGTVQLDASGSSDNEQPDNTTLTYAWDFDGDGQYDDATGIAPAFSAAVLDGPATVTAGLLVTDDDGASDTATALITVTQPEPIDLGTVDFTQLSPLVLPDGHIWYRLTAARSGLLTAIASATAGSAAVNLYDSLKTVPPLAVSTAMDGAERLDQAVEAGATYFLRIAGSSTDAALTIANLVTTTGTEIQVFGTDGADAFQFTPTGSYQITINGVPYDFDDSAYETIVFNGGLGDDTAALTGGPDREVARFSPDHGTFGENGFLVTVNDVASITAHGGGGLDEAYLYDSPGDDEFVSRRGYGKLSGDGFSLETFDFMVNYGYATTKNGGDDVAYMEDTPGADKFKFDWPASGQFFGKMYGGGLYYNRAKNFEQIEAVMTEGKNTVCLFDSEGDDSFYGQKDESRMTGPGYNVIVSGYNSLMAYASTGSDIAHLEDSTDDDETRARPHKIVFWSGDATDPTYEISARKFDEYHFEAKNGGYDRAKLHDTALADHVVVEGDTVRVYRNSNGLDLLYEVVAFEWVKLYGTDNESHDTLKKQDPLNFDLVYDQAMWEEVP